MKGKELNLISPNDFENELHEEFVVFVLVAKKVLEEALEEVSAVLKKFQDVFPLKVHNSLPCYTDLVLY